MQTSPEKVYQDHRNVVWTRIEMLNELYGAAVDATEKVAEALSQGSPTATSYRLKAIALVNAIESGLDLSQGELPQHIQQLCHYVHQCLVDGEFERIKSAAHVLRQLAEGFQGIQNEAIQLEENGVVPPLQFSRYDTLA